MRYTCVVALVAVLGMLLVPSVTADDSEADDNTYDFDFSITWYKDSMLNNRLDLSADSIVKYTTTSRGDLLDAPDMSRYQSDMYPRDAYVFVGWWNYDETWDDWNDLDEYYYFTQGKGYLTEVTKEYIEYQYDKGVSSIRLVAYYESVEDTAIAEGSSDNTLAIIIIFAVIIALIAVCCYVCYRRQP